MNNYTRSRQRWAFAAGAAMVLFFVGLVWLLSSCETPAPVVPIADSGGGQMTDGCEIACKNLRRLNCPEAKPNAKGMECAEVCRRAERLRDMNTVCVATAGDLDDLRECGTVRCVW